MKILKALLLTAAMSVTGPALAENGRFVMEKTENGYVRMDTATGEMSICAERDGQIICRLAADERAAFQDALDRLEERVAKLESLVGPGFARRMMPSEEDFDRGLDNMEEMFRRFLGIVEELENDRQSADRT